MLYLKKLSAALRDNDPVRGIIRGTAVTAYVILCNMFRAK